MALEQDDTVCYCFHVSVRKIETFCRVQKPRHASQISQCLSAGTGCGWCIPLIQKIHASNCPQAAQPWWREPPAEANAKDSAQDYASADQYAQARQAYLAAKKPDGKD